MIEKLLNMLSIKKFEEWLNKSNKGNIQQPKPKPTQVEPTISNSTD